jgi:predicted amidohydrolase
MKGKAEIGSTRGKLTAQLPAGGGAVAFSPDNKLLAAGEARGIIRIWDIAGGRIVRTLRLDDRPPDTVLVAAIQCASKFGDPAANRQTLQSLIRSAAHNGAKIIVLPEAAVTGYLTDDIGTTWQVGDRSLSEGLKGADPKEAAETVPGPSTELFGKLADEYGVYVAVPLVEVDRKTGRYYNTSVLLGPDGRILLHYRKRDPWPWAERGWATPGDRGNPVVDTPFGRLGLLICYDIHDQAKIMGQLKIDTLLYSIAWVDNRDSDWFPEKLPAIAKSNGFNVVAANWIVPKSPAPAWHGYGQSRIIDRSGEVLAEARDDLGEETIFTELPLPRPEPHENVR